MAQNDDVIIVGSLDKKELEKSIQDLVDYVGNKTNDMATKFTEGLDKMKLAMKDFAITQKVSVDLMKEAWRNMSSSFDAMVAAQSTATSNPHGGGGTSATPNSIKDLKEQISAAERLRDTFQQTSPQVAAINKQIEDMRTHLQNILAKGTLKEQMAQARKEIGNANTMSTKDLQSAQSKLAALEAIQRKYAHTTILSEQQTNRLATAIENCKNKIDRFKNAQPKTLRDVLGMDESSVDAIAKKMQALKRVSVDPNNSAQVKRLGDEYARLQREQAKLMGKNIQLTHSNNYLAQSFGYIRNRIVYALTLGAVTNFTKEIYEVRGQYELLERSLGILIDNMRRGSEIFNELNAMALKSPFTLIELATGAKQLMAYNFAEDEVVETTRRLADISSALGVPMERLVYNLGQIRAQTVLTARDARDFANAGLAIVPMLADLYTKQKKFGDEIVTTSQVYAMMSNKMVSYADVMKVINSITDEGGKFFDFQAKQAETMKVQMNNLTLAYNNMLNEIGKNNQGVLTAPLKGLKLLFENWRMLEKAIRAAIVAMGMYYTRATLVKLINGTLITQGTIRAGYLLAAGWDAAKNALIGLRTVMITNPFGALAVAISTAIGYMALFNDSVNEMTEYNNRFGESGGSVVRDVEALYGSIESLDKESATYKKVVAELNQILGDFNLTQIDEKANIDEILKSREKNIQLIKEEILERKHLNDLQQGRDTYDEEVKKARERLRSNLSNAITENFFGIGTINEEIAKNAPALTNIISDIIESNIELVANKTGDEYEKGVETIFAKIQERLKSNKALGLSEETINSTWLENNFFRFYKSNIISNVINDLKDAKEANDQYNESVNENYEAEKRAAEQGATFNDRVKQSSDSLLKAANDTDKFYGKINQLIKDYSGQNIIDFLVRVNAEVPTWMAKMNGTELARLSARFAALASQAKKAGKEGLNVNGTYFTTQQLYERAAQYASAVKQKQADTEARKSATITKEASQALKDYKQSIEAVRIAKNRLKQGTADQTLVTEKEAEAQKKYNIALQKGVSLEDLKKAKDGKQRKTQKDPLGDALQKEIQLINDIQKAYKEYRKAGVDAETAKTAAANEYTKSLQTQNAQLKRFGIKGLTGEQLATMDLREIRDYYQGMLDIASKLKNVKGVEVLEKALRGINVEITKLDYKKITDGLNNQLGKLKDEYELAIELDANPELGNMFADMFGITPDMLSEMPHTVGQLVDKYQDEIDKQLKGKFNTPFNILKTDINKWVKDTNVDPNSELVKTLSSKQSEARGMVQKTYLDIQKMVDDYVKEYGDQQQQIEQIEKEKNNALLQLNSIYKTEALRQTKEYLNEEEAIRNAAKIKEAKATFAALKKTTDYDRFFNAIDTLTSKDALAIKVKIKQGIIQAFKDGGLTVSEFRREIKALESQFDKLTESSSLWTNYLSGGFDKLIQKARETGQEIETIGESISIKGTIDDKDKNFLQSMGNIFSDGNGGSMDFTSLMNKFGGNMKGLGEAVSQAGQGMQQGAGGFASAIAVIDMVIKNVHQTVQAIGSVIDELDSVRNEENKLSNAYWEGFKKSDSYATSGWENLKSGNIAGAVSDTANSIISLFNILENAKNEKINEQIKDSERAVKSLENSYKNLEYAAENAFGASVAGAQEATKANKELQLVELKRQLALEQSRSSKNRDEDRIIELRGQIIDLEYEIKDFTKNAVNELLGISSHGDFFESMISEMIEAFKNGEDAMDVFEEKWSDMIDNMLMKSIVSQVLSQWVKTLERGANDILEKYTGDASKKMADVETQMTYLRTMGAGAFSELLYDNDRETFNKILESLGVGKVENMSWRERQNWFGNALDSGLAKKIMDSYLAILDNNMAGLQNELSKASLDATGELIDYYGEAGKEFKENYLTQILDKIQENWNFGQDSERQLSNLQQGLQSTSEDTGSALESYMNGVSQQVYLHSDLLTQIRDAVVGMDMDVQLGTLSEILLQLQSSYQVQMSIQAILAGVLNPSGRAFSVELIS